MGIWDCAPFLIPFGYSLFSIFFKDSSDVFCNAHFYRPAALL